MQRPKWHDYLMGAGLRIQTANQKAERAEADVVRLIKELDKDHGRAEACDIAVETLKKAGLYTERVQAVIERLRSEA